MAEIVACRACGHGSLESVLSLGKTPLANALITPETQDESEPMFPLDLVRCPACSLVQITETVDPEILFRDYVYFSSFSTTMIEHARGLVERLVRERSLDPDCLAVEVASNDGYLLQWYQRLGVPVLGIEPARNVAQVAIERHGIPTECQFFGAATATTLRDRGHRADVLHAHNVLAHVADLNGFVAGIERLLKPEGVAVVEVPYLKDMLDGCEFDTIYHEHLCYFSLTALSGLFERHGLRPIRVERVPIHGGTLRLFAAPIAGAVPDATVETLLSEETAWGVCEETPYRNFATRVAALGERLQTELRRLRREGKTIAAYGASAKGTTLLHYAGIESDLIDFVVDRSTVKQGRRTPGKRFLIRPPEALLEEQPDFVLLLTWNFADEILRQQSTYRERGGRFILPIPEWKVV